LRDALANGRFRIENDGKAHQEKYHKKNIAEGTSIESWKTLIR
jgi:hypothetical protein